MAGNVCNSTEPFPCDSNTNAALLPQCQIISGNLKIAGCVITTYVSMFLPFFYHFWDIFFFHSTSLPFMKWIRCAYLPNLQAIQGNLDISYNQGGTVVNLNGLSSLKQVS